MPASNRTATIHTPARVPRSAAAPAAWRGAVALAALLLLFLPVRAPAQTREGLTTYSSLHYLIHTNLTRDEVRAIGAHMDLIFAEYQKRFSSFSSRRQAPFELYLFRKQEQYLAHMKACGIDAANSGGMFVYSERAKGLFTFVQGKSRAVTFETLQHEGFHQFAFDYIGPGLPVWVNEGLAQYFQDGLLISGAMNLGLVNGTRLAAVKAGLKTTSAADFDRLIKMTDAQWAATLITKPKESGLLYDQAWSVTFFLIHGDGGRYRPNFESFLTLLSKDLPPAEAFAQAFGSPDTSSFYKRWNAYIQALEPDAINLAVSRMEFLGQALRWLQEHNVTMPRNIDELRTILQHDGYKAWRTTHGITFEFDARNNAFYEFPRPGGPGKFQFLEPGAPGLPPRLTAPGLKPAQPTLIFSRDPDGQLVQDVEFGP